MKKFFHFIVHAIGSMALGLGAILLLIVTSPFWAPVILVALSAILASIIVVLAIFIALFATFWWLIIPLILVYFGGRLLGMWE
jgi:hypothetical protein